MNGFYFAIITAVVWGIVPIMEKMGLASIMPLSGLLIRSCGVIIGAVVLAVFNREVVSLALKADIKTVLFLASILGQIFFYNALKTGEASKIVPIAGTYPLVSFLIGIIFLGESFTFVKAAGVMFVIAGLFLLR